MRGRPTSWLRYPQRIGIGTWLGIDCPKKPKLTTFCVQRSDVRGDLSETVQAAARAGYDIGSIQDFSRQNTEGETLRWRLASDHHRAGFAALPMAGLVPFVVDWSPNKAEGMKHPSAIAPEGCRLVELRASHLDATALQNLWQTFRTGFSIAHVEDI